MEPFESFEHAGFVCELHQDIDPMAPSDWDQLGTMFSFSFESALQGFEDCPHDVFEAWNHDRPGLTVRYLRAKGELAVLFQFQDYGSSGARILALDDDEDGRATGYVSTTPARIGELCGPPQIPSDPFYAPRTWPADGRSGRNWEGTAEDWVRSQLRGELAQWDAYVEGRVVGYVVRDPESGGVVSSVWGFYPDGDGDGYEYVRDEARSDAESQRDERARRALEVRQGWAFAHGRREAMPV